MKKSSWLFSFLIPHSSSFILSFFAGLFRGRLTALLFQSESRQQRFDARGRLLDRVAHEMKFGSVLEVEQDTQLPAHVRVRVLERLERRRLLRVRPLGCHVDARVAQVFL